MYVTKTPAVVKALYSSLVWNMPRNTNEVFLTFDDGPHPEITPLVLTQLKNHTAKASFFCIGKNIEQNNSTFLQLKNDGHSIGNHTYDHVNGWQTDNASYFESVKKCQELTQTKLFRPPYGKITRQQSKKLKEDYKIIMWDVLSADFDKSISKEKCLNNVLKNIQPGSIVVFHDSEKAAEKMLYALDKVLEFIQKKGWVCKGL
jgi:peptidoglycan/xylan/chitin deacetylase (PgdA/CDA1 family)